MPTWSSKENRFNERRMKVNKCKHEQNDAILDLDEYKNKYTNYFGDRLKTKFINLPDKLMIINEGHLNEKYIVNLIIVSYLSFMII